MTSYNDLPPSAGLSRRDFSRLLAAGAAGVMLPHGSAEAHLARRAAGAWRGADLIRINSNENPLGPSRAALEAMHKLGALGGRYAWKEEEELVARYAAMEGVPADHVLFFAGSSDPLHRAVLAFTGPGRPFVFGEPGFEAGKWAAAVSGAPVLPVALTPTIAHDVRAMCAASPSPGMLYVCSPNNPTGTVTPRDEILWALANKPAGAILLVDEAYIHLSEEETVAPLVASHADLLVLRTFSKLYGMAGLRVGVAMAQPPVLEKLKSFGMGALSISGVAAARASLDEPKLVAERRSYVKQVREETFDFLTKHGIRFKPSVSNCFMMDAGRPAKELADAMAQKGILIGRTWPVWPNDARITVGTRDEMKRFGEALLQVMA